MSVTVRDVAAAAGVSAGTASRALRGHPQISERCIERVRRVAAELGYQPLRDRTGRRRSEPLAGKRIAIAMFGIDRTLASLPVVGEAIHGAEEALTEAGAHPVLVNVPDPTEPPRSLRRVRFDGILAKAALQGDLAAAIGPKLRGVLESNALVWMLGRPAGIEGDAVNPDNKAIGRIAAEALVAAGHSRLAIVNPKADHEMFAIRGAAFTELATELGATVRPHASKWSAPQAFPLQPIMDVGGVQPLVDALLAESPRPTAIFCPADSIAAMVYRALACRGVRPGTDIAILSCNNERGIVAGLWPALATIDVHPRWIGQLAVRQLKQRITGEFAGAAVTVEVAPTLIPEASLAPLQAGGGPSRLRSLLAALVLTGAAAAAAEPAIRFDRDIRPILAENCYACHGPGTQEAGLRLDSHEAATAELESGSRAIVAGDLKASEMLIRITATDPDVVMPPPHANKAISPEQRDLLGRWIAAGAPYEQHWAFRPVVRTMPPAAATLPPTNPVDSFLEARLAEANVPVNPEADRPTLLRRLSFALTGLPPTPAELAAFLADTAADAYEKQVERLLHSPHHGEEMARHWLDAARYADTHGLHLDNERQIWAYRDWVVKAFNDNLPFDQFTIWQLAGDLLPAATTEQQVATGFSRCNVTTSEGGSIDDELLFRYAVDRTATMTNAFMGLTGQCAVCHDHKFDPVSQREFYALYAFFNSAADPGFDGNVLRTAPSIPLPTPAQASELALSDGAIAEAERRVAAAMAAVDYTDPAEAGTKPAAVPLETVWLDDDFPAGADVRSGPGGPLGWLESDEPGAVLSGRRSLVRTAVGIGQDFCQDLRPPLEVPANATIFVHAWTDPANPPRALMLQLRTADWKHRAIWGDWTALQLENEQPERPSLFKAGGLPAAGRWARLAVDAKKLGLAPGARVTGFALTQCDGHVRWDRLGVSVAEDPAASPTRSLTAWWRARKEHAGPDVPADLAAIVARGPERTTDAGERERVRRHWLARVWAERPAELAAAVRDLDAARKIRDDFARSFVHTLVFNDLPRMRDSFVMQRGAYDSPGDKVERGTPAFLPPLAVPPGKVPDRLDLATWLVSGDHPLTPRVAVNRLWQQFFGTGLVKTSEDFGLQGEPPAHPELLDWLAAEYRAGGWDTRRMVRLLVTSRAFRRASAARPEQLAADPENRLLARGPRIRLDAEQIRDNALAVSGLLVRTLGGKGVKPYQPPNIWEPVGFGNSNTRFYSQDSGAALYRRTIYLFVKRTAPHPALTNFDAPNREQFCARRERSNTPLQSLQLMNDVQHVEAARALAARTLTECRGADAARIEWLYTTVLARRPSAEEAQIVRQSLAGHRARYAADAEAARRTIAHGESQPPAGLAPAELAAWTLVANLMLNLDETLNRN